MYTKITVFKMTLYISLKNDGIKACFFFQRNIDIKAFLELHNTTATEKQFHEHFRERK